MTDIEENLNGFSKIKDVSESIREFNKLKYARPKKYTRTDIIKLRKKLKVSQSVFAYILNAKVTTIQKWESGVHHPNGVICRLLQIIERNGPGVLQKGAADKMQSIRGKSSSGQLYKNGK